MLHYAKIKVEFLTTYIVQNPNLEVNHTWNHLKHLTTARNRNDFFIGLAAMKNYFFVPKESRRKLFSSELLFHPLFLP